MVSSTLSILLVAFATTQMAVAVPTAAPTDIVGNGSAWPAAARVGDSLNVYTPRAETNAERIKRGEKLAKPVKLYGPSEVHAAPKARLSPAPQTATASGKTFALVGCYTGRNSGNNLGTLTATSSTDAVDQCISLCVSASATTFMIEQTDTNSYACYSWASSNGVGATCSSSNWAYYSQQ